MRNQQQIIKDVTHLPHFFDRQESNALFNAVMESTTWSHESIMVFGRPVLQPRLSATQGDAGTSINYNGRSFPTTPWSPAVQVIKERVEKETGVTFNAVLMNLYRDGQDGVGFHSDDDIIGGAQTIASVSLGATRRFVLQPQKHLAGQSKVEVELGHGDLLVMAGQTQQNWKHGIPKTKKIVGPRINLTFRDI